jgi:chlorobactene glucosyltransferase
MFLWFSFGSLFFLALVALFNLLTAPRLKAGLKDFHAQIADPAIVWPMVSILIPARNEAHQIAKCIKSLLRSSYPKFEIIVADDQSSDETPTILAELAAQHAPRLRVLTLSEPPPPGWTGKARTCHELANHASGDFFVFCDADVKVQPDAVAATVGWILHKGMDAVTALPTQEGGTPIVRAVVSTITQFLILVTLPLYLVPRSRSRSLATGNGQWFAWRRSLYEKVGGHEVVRSSRIEDVALARAVKSVGGKLVSVFSPRLIRVKMYADWSSARQGFHKNLFSLVGESIGGVFLVCLFVLMCGAAPIVAWLYGVSSMVLMIFSVLIFLGWAQNQAFGTDFKSLLLLPLGVFLTLVLLCESAYRTKKGNIVWKDRSLPFAV